MKKRVLSALLAVSMVSGLLTGCGSSSNEQQGANGSNGDVKLALVTDVGTIDDKSFNQGSWEGLQQYAEEKGISSKYYKPSEKSDEAILTSINLAIKGGAEFVVCPGYLFENAVYNAQSANSDTKFLILDGEPKDASGNSSIADNTLAVYYAEEQAGFLAGYAAVKDGYRKLGFMGGIKVPAVVRYGYGYIQGADYAAKELGLAKGDVTVKYTYVGNFDATPENQTLAKSWYNEGIEVIFGCGGGVGNSVMKAAEDTKKKVIGVDVDQSTESDTVITSAMKNLGKSVYDSVSDFYDGKFEGGKSITLDVTTDGVQLPMDSSKFENFTKDDYDAIYAKLVSGEIKVQKNDVAEDVDGLTTEIVTVSEVK